MSKSQDYIPKAEPVLLSFLENIVVKLPGYSNEFKMNTIDTDVPFHFDALMGTTALAFYGRYPDYVQIRIQNTGTVPLNFGTTILPDGALIAPITALAAGASVDTDFLTMGGPGRIYLRVENPSLVTDGSFAIFTTRLGRMINAAERTLLEINRTTQVLNDYYEQVEIKDRIKKDNISLLRDDFQDMKKNKKFTPAIGDDLHIISAPKIIDVATSKPDLTSKRVPAGWEIGYNLLNFFSGITINRKRPADAGFSFWRQRVGETSVIDTEPMDNGTQYQAYFMIGNELVGQPSTILTISV